MVTIKIYPPVSRTPLRGKYYPIETTGLVADTGSYHVKCYVSSMG